MTKKTPRVEDLKICYKTGEIITIMCNFPPPSCSVSLVTYLESRQ